MIQLPAQRSHLALPVDGGQMDHAITDHTVKFIDEHCDLRERRLTSAIIDSTLLSWPS
jgi:hypothetical protein